MRDKLPLNNEYGAHISYYQEMVVGFISAFSFTPNCYNYIYMYLKRHWWIQGVHWVQMNPYTIIYIYSAVLINCSYELYLISNYCI